MPPTEPSPVGLLIVVTLLTQALNLTNDAPGVYERVHEGLAIAADLATTRGATPQQLAQAADAGLRGVPTPLPLPTALRIADHYTQETSHA
ncbi:hypothetical protein [Nocardia farcinica]|uniref:hypothetical protein n=1 Tax=Nocardia farcinica TaxID=37329 RepID=UPI0024548894|nr:hypothetical protein [Nocardia farcinica]